MVQVTPALLRALGVREATAACWAVHIDVACRRHAINSRLRLAAFLANVLQETGNLSQTVESLNYTPERLMQVWPSHIGPSNAYRLGRTAEHPADEKLIAETVYGGRLGNGPPGSGDGWLYRGRGLIQLTGKSNYQGFSAKTGIPLADLPTLLQLPAGAAESAATYWEGAVCNVLADRSDIEGVRRAVNGGTNGMAEVRALYARALAAIPADEPAPALAPPAPSPPPPVILSWEPSMFKPFVEAIGRRLTEPSTWAGILTVLGTLLRLQVPPDYVEPLTTALAAVVGTLLVYVRETKA